MPYKELSLTQFRSLVEVCRLGSYAEAARRLDLSTSAVWEQVRGLERRYEAALVENKRGSVHATADGKRLLDLVLPLLAGLESAKEVIHQERGQPPRSITLVSGMRMLLEEVGRAIAEFRQTYPGVSLRLLYAEDREIESIIERGEADLALMLEPGPGRTKRATVEHEAAYELEYMLVTPPGHSLLAKRRLRLEDITRHPLVIGVPGTSSRRRIDEVLHRHNLLDAVNLAVETNSAAMTFAYVRANAGVGITAGNRLGFLCEGLGLRPLGAWFGAARYIFVWLRGAFIPPAQRTLADLIRASASAGNDGSPSPARSR
jgi:molybdate transport repressor ModE-like protein